MLLLDEGPVHPQPFESPVDPGGSPGAAETTQKALDVLEARRNGNLSMTGLARMPRTQRPGRKWVELLTGNIIYIYIYVYIYICIHM